MHHFINMDPTAIFSTTKIQREDPEDPEEGEHLFHSQMWVKGLHYNPLSIVKYKIT